MDKSVDSKTLASLFEAARWAPSSGNGQPWGYLVATTENPAEYERLASVLNSIPGVVEHGLFIGLASILVLAGPQGIRAVERP